MISNPFSRRPNTPVDQALDAFDDVRSEAADYAAAIRDAAADIADTLTEIGPPAPKRRLPVAAAAAAAALGVAYLVRSRLGGSAPGPAPEVPGRHATPTATATAARETAGTAPAGDPPAPGDSEEPKEPRAATAESGSAGFKADQGDVPGESQS